MADPKAVRHVVVVHVGPITRNSVGKTATVQLTVTPRVKYDAETTVR